MTNADLVKDPNKLYWDEGNNVYMQYSPVSDRFLVKRVSPWDIDKEEYNPNNLPRYRAESSNSPLYDYNKLQNKTKSNKYINLFPSNLQRNSSSFASKYRMFSSNPYKFNDRKNNLHASNYVSLNTENNHQKGIMQNNYFEDVDTLALTKQYPELGRITQFSASKSIPKKMWAHLGDGVNYLSSNELGRNLLGLLPYKSLRYIIDQTLTVPGHSSKLNKSITFPQSEPDISSQVEELFHHGQFNFYDNNGRKSSDIPGMNLEMEAKTGVDIIIQKDTYNQSNENDEYGNFGVTVAVPRNGGEQLVMPSNGNANNFINETSSKIFMGADMNDSYINYLNDRYLSMINRVSEGRKFTTEDRKTYNEIGTSLSHEKSNHDTRPFNVSIPPEMLLHILKK